MAYIIGDTIRLKATFKDWDGNAADPDTVDLRVYDGETIYEEEPTILLEQDVTANSLQAGEYYYDYVITGTQSVVYEFKGMLGGKPSVVRKTLTFVFVEN